MIYLDNAATTQIHPEVLDAMLPYLKEEYGNAGAMYGLGRRAANAVAEARRQVANLIGCEPSQVIFTSGGSEANNLVFSGLRPYLLANGKTHIITSAVEHDSVLKAVKSVCNPLCCNTKNVIKPDFDTDYLGVTKDGVIRVDDLRDSVTANTGLVSIMYVNNETGAINPIQQVGQLCRQNHILFHTDCVQAAGCQSVDVETILCDFLSLSAHKINAPKGVGALYARDPTLLSPIIHGGSEQEFGYRGGTENVAGIVGFGQACEILARDMEKNNRKVIALKSEFITSLRRCLTNFKLQNIIHINSPEQSVRVLNIRFENVDGQTLLLMLDTKGVCISAGSACRSHEAKPSHVLMAMGLSEDAARDSVRVSFSQTLTHQEVITAAHSVAECVFALSSKGGVV